MLASWSFVPDDIRFSWLAPVLVLDSVILGFQLSLVRRAIRAQGASLSSYFLVILSFVILGLVGVTALNRLAVASMKDAPDVEATMYEVDLNGAARLEGMIDFAHYAALKSLLEKDAHGVRVVHLNSTGGRIPAARGIARLIREAGLDTHVSGTCASACTIIFIAGNARTIQPDGRIGFHGYRLLSTIATVDVAEEERKDRAAFLAKGVTATFLERAYSVPHSEMWFPSHRTLLDAGVVTQPN